MSIIEEKGWTVTYIPWEDMEGKPREVGRIKTTKEKDEYLDKVVSKYPENTQICEEILKKVNNNTVKIEEDPNANTTLYLVMSNKIFIANLNKSYTRIQTIAHECLHSIQDKPVEIIKDNDYTRTHWYSLNAPKDLSRFSIKIDEDVFSYVQSLNTNFTTLLSESLYSFSSFYTMRIYELLQQWYPKKKQIAYRMQTLKEYLQLDYRVVIEKGVEKELNKSYRNNSNFNKRIIEPAIKEINEHSELSVTYEFLRNSGKGKSKIEGICFYVDSIEIKEEKILIEIKDPHTQFKEETIE